MKVKKKPKATKPLVSDIVKKYLKDHKDRWTAISTIAEDLNISDREARNAIKTLKRRKENNLKSMKITVYSYG